MSDALRQLVAVLRRQADSLEAALALTEAQTTAITRRDLEQVTQLTRALEQELSQGTVLEERRMGFAAELAAALGVEAGETTLGTLANALPREEGRALMRAGDTVVRAVERIARQSAANQSLLEHELAVIDQVVRVAHRGDRSTYAGTGAYATQTIALLDARA